MKPTIFEPRLKFKPRLKFFKFGLKSLFKPYLFRTFFFGSAFPSSSILNIKYFTNPKKFYQIKKLRNLLRNSKPVLSKVVQCVPLFLCYAWQKLFADFLKISCISIFLIQTVKMDILYRHLY